MLKLSSVAVLDIDKWRIGLYDSVGDKTVESQEVFIVT